MHAQPLKPAFHLWSQGIIGRSHISVFRVRVDRRDDSGKQHGVAAGRVLEGRVRVPEPIAQAVHALAVVGLIDFSARVEVGDIGQCLVAQAAFLERADPGLGVQPAVQALRKGQVLLVREVLVAEDEQGVLVHAGANLQQRLRVSHLAEINGADLGHEMGMELAKCQGHMNRSSLKAA